MEDLIVKSRDEKQIFLIWGQEDWIHTELDPSMKIELLVNNENDFFGNTFKGIGDYNNDGFEDLAIGNFLSTKVTLIWGASKEHFAQKIKGLDCLDLHPEVGLIIKNSMPFSYFSWSLSPVGDINHDGYWDMLVGDWRNSALYCILGMNISHI